MPPRRRKGGSQAAARTRSQRTTTTTTDAAPANTLLPAASTQPPRPPPPVFPCLPPELLASVFSSLPATDVGRAACASKAWRDVISGDATCWERAMTELDPFCSLGGVAGAESLVAAAGDGCWLRAAAALATRMLPCDKCKYAPGCKLCRCPARTRAEKAAVAAAVGGRRHRCCLHCASSPGCFRLIGNRWLFSPEPKDTITLHGDGDVTSGLLLRGVIVAARPFTTLRLTGRFEFYDPDQCNIWRPLRVVGDGNTTITVRGAPLFVEASIVLMENLTVVMESEEPGGYECDCGCCYDVDYFDWQPTYSPAVQVETGAKLIAHRLTATSEMGTAIMLHDGSSAYLQDCKASSYNPFMGNQCLGVVAKNNTMLAMYDCKISRAMWGLFAGPEAGVLSRYNKFSNIDCEDITTMYNQYSGHTVQPWHGAWTRRS